MKQLFAGSDWAYQRARLVLIDHFQKPQPAPAPVTAADFGPAVLDPRMSGEATAASSKEDLPGGVLPAGYQLVDLNPSGDLEVVGELHYLETLRKIRSSYGKNAVAVLEPMRSGEHLQVRVSLLSGERYYHIGFLPAAEGSQYVPILERLARNKQIGLCPARLWWPEGKEDELIQVYLRLAAPAELIPDAPPLGRYLNLTGFTTVVVTKEEDHQQALDFFGPQESIWFRLGFCTIKRGKYAGERTIQVRLEDHVVGQLTYLMGQRYGAAVQGGLARGQEVICQGQIIDEPERGLQVELFMQSQQALAPGVGYDGGD